MILEVLQTELARVARENASVAIIMADLDHFKQINDTYGHRAGDEVLRETSKKLRLALRSYDMLGRYGGEEFLIILPGCDSSNALKVAERARQSIAANPVRTPVWTIPITISLGVAATSKGQRLSPDELIKAADEVLYKAKKGGRNRVEMAKKI
jgi:diguanylate cyclase (GGDEF)-like protein